MTSEVALLVTASYDLAADYVARALTERGCRHFRLNTDKLQKTDIVFSPGGATIATHEARVTSADVRSVWYRRHVAPELPADLQPGVVDFCQREYRALISGALAAIPAETWLSDPRAIYAAEAKPYQLSVAHQIGFDLPRTLITNNPERARDFAQEQQVVAKAVSSGYVREQEGTQGIFTSRVRDTDLSDLEGLRLAPVIFQELIDKRCDIRVTVVDQTTYAAEIMSQEHPSSAIDWRATETPNLGHRRHELPPDVAALCRTLLTRLGLKFGAIDLALTKDGQYIFFEINPSGEWVWIEDLLGYPIAAEIARFLDCPEGG